MRESQCQQSWPPPLSRPAAISRPLFNTKLKETDRMALSFCLRNEGLLKKQYVGKQRKTWCNNDVPHGDISDSEHFQDLPDSASQFRQPAPVCAMSIRNLISVTMSD